VEDQALAKRLGLAGQRRVKEQFSAQSMADRVADVYRTLAQTTQG